MVWHRALWPMMRTTVTSLIQSPTYLADQVPHAMADRPDEHRLAIPRHPDQVPMDLEHALCPVTILVHGAYSTAMPR